MQDSGNSKPRFGSINKHPDLININFIDELRLNAQPDSDIVYANGLVYDEENNLIYLSVNYFNGVCVMNHSTTIAEAESGGNFGKGANLVYRFGNTSVYKNEFGERLFYINHFPNLLENKEAGVGNMLIFDNGNGDSKQSIVYELSIPSEFILKIDANDELDVV